MRPHSVSFCVILYNRSWYSFKNSINSNLTVCLIFLACVNFVIRALPPVKVLLREINQINVLHTIHVSSKAICCHLLSVFYILFFFYFLFALFILAQMHFYDKNLQQMALQQLQRIHAIKKCYIKFSYIFVVQKVKKKIKKSLKNTKMWYCWRIGLRGKYNTFIIMKSRNK